MNKIFLFLISAFISFALLQSCSSDSPDRDEGTGKAAIILAIDMQPYAQNGYVLPVQELAESTASFTNAMEVKAGPYIVNYNDWIFYVPTTNDGTIIRYSRNENGSLREDGKLTIGMAAPICSSLAFVSSSKAYAAAMGDNKIIVFNPTTMTKTSEINLADSRWGVDGSNTPGPLGLFLRSGKLFVGCGQFDQMPITKAGAHIIIIDEATNTPEKMISDTRLSSASIFPSGMFVDEKNDLYVTCWGSYGYVSNQKFGLLRIKSGATEFDHTYCFNMSDMNVSGVEGGKLQYSITNFYAGDGELYVLGYCPAFASPSGPNYIKDMTMYSLKADLYTYAMETLPLPRTNGYSCAINQLGDDILFGLTTEANGSGIFTYNRKTGVSSAKPLVSVNQGTIMGMVVYR